MVINNEEIYEDDDFIISLTIDGTSYEEVEVKVTDPNKTIRDQIAAIVAVFELPTLDNGGCPIQYFLAQNKEDEDMLEVLEFEDGEGHEQALIDYNIQPGDHLVLTACPVCGCIWCNIITVRTINLLIFKYKYLKIFTIDDSPEICRLYGWIDEIIKRLVSSLNLPKNTQYYLAKLKEGNDSDVKLYFLNDNNGKNNYRKSIFHYYWQNLRPNGNECPDLILFPASGISKRIMKQIEKYCNCKSR